MDAKGKRCESGHLMQKSWKFHVFLVVMDILVFEDGTGMLIRNVGTQLSSPAE